MKSTPCPMPTYLTKIGLPQIYFIGMATNRRRRKESPSRKPTIRKDLIFMVTESKYECVASVTEFAEKLDKIIKRL